MKYGLKGGKMQRINEDGDWNVQKHNINKMNMEEKKRNKERRDDIK
jgi:hypothetical protein